MHACIRACVCWCIVSARLAHGELNRTCCESSRTSAFDSKRAFMSATPDGRSVQNQGCCMTCCNVMRSVGLLTRMRRSRSLPSGDSLSWSGMENSRFKVRYRERSSCLNTWGTLNQHKRCDTQLYTKLQCHHGNKAQLPKRRHQPNGARDACHHLQHWRQVCIAAPIRL